MAPNKRGGPPSFTVKAAADAGTRPEGSVISKEEVEARGSGTADTGDTYDSRVFIKSETRVFFTGVYEPLDYALTCIESFVKRASYTRLHA